MERSPALAAPSSNSYGGLIASTTSKLIGAKAGNRQALSEKEEDDLCKKYRPLVLSLAKRYSGKGVEFKELKSAGLTGLALALRKFNPGAIVIVEMSAFMTFLHYSGLRKRSAQSWFSGSSRAR